MATVKNVDAFGTAPAVVTGTDADETFKLTGADGAGYWGGTIVGGNGSDTLDGSTVTTNLAVGTAGTADYGSELLQVSGIEHLIGGSGGDNFLMALSTENLTIDGGAGDDRIVGGSGNDVIHGGAGNDIVSGYAGSDQIYGDDGDDQIVETRSAPSADTLLLDGGAGNDTLNLLGLGVHVNLATGAGDLSGATLKVANIENVTVFGGTDILVTGDAGDNVLTFSPTFDTGESKVTFNGGPGADTLRGGRGDDVLNGGDGNDTLYPGHGRNVVDGGSGTDTLLLDGKPGDYAVSLTAQGYSVRLENTVDDVRNVELVSFDNGATSMTMAQFMQSSFSAARYLASYADLRAAYGNNLAAATQHWQNTGQGEHRDPGLFDAREYGASNPDLAKAFGDDASALAWHYITTGLKEGRALASFDALAYGASNPDLAKAFGSDVELLTDHYLTAGVREGRPLNSFDVLGYAASNPDLIQAFGTNLDAYRKHYLDHGMSEGRPTSGFDALEYGASNPDLAQAFGADKAALELHYIKSGFAEHRPLSGFDALEYAASNPDLIKALGNDQQALLTHYLQHGMAEHRPTASFDAFAYASVNPDLVQTLGLDPQALEQQYVTSGYAQGRPTSGFDAVAYLLSSPDLAAEGIGVTGALQQWLTTGINENRPGDTLYGHDQTSHLLSIGQKVAGAIDFVGDHDWYAVNIAAGDRVNFNATAAAGSSISDLTVSIFDANGNLLSSGHNAAGGANGGLFYVSVNATHAEDLGAYQLTTSHF